MARRRHHFQLHAGLQLLVGPVGEQPAVDTLDRHAQLRILYRRADRIRAAHVLATDAGAQRQVLALDVAVGVGQFIRHGKGHGHGIAGFAGDRGHGQFMEFAHLTTPVRLSAP
ncbi:hypothetical protein D3C72_2080800 [compost metagenome]